MYYKLECYKEAQVFFLPYMKGSMRLPVHVCGEKTETTDVSSTPRGVGSAITLQHAAFHFHVRILHAHTCYYVDIKTLL